LLDTQRLDAEQLECGLKLCWCGVNCEAMAGAQRHAHGVAGQGAEVCHELAKTHDRLSIALRRLLKLPKVRKWIVEERRLQLDGSGLVLTAKAGDMKLFVNKLDDLHQWDFVYVQKLRASWRKTYEERESWKRRALMAETNVVAAAEERENWKRGALMAETKVVEAAASPRSGQVVSDLKYATLKRWLAKQFHPDCAPGNGFEKVVRNEILKEIWSEIERLDRQLSTSSDSAIAG
jgi:hypothetical protein